VPGPNPWLRMLQGAVGPRAALPGLDGLLVGLAGVGLLVYGQVLNGAVFHKLGEAGVYYGVRFGHHIPWVEGFPFNHMSHAQYVGSVMTCWAPLLVCADFVNFREMAPLMAFWSFAYFTSSMAEDYGELHKPHEAALEEPSAPASRKRR